MIEMVSTVVTFLGLRSELMFAGAAGGWLALTYQEPSSFAKRFSRIILSSLAATWFTPWTIHQLALTTEPALVKFPLAFGLGLITMDVLGRGIISLARKWFKEKGHD